MIEYNILSYWLCNSIHWFCGEESDFYLHVHVLSVHIGSNYDYDERKWYMCRYDEKICVNGRENQGLIALCMMTDL